MIFSAACSTVSREAENSEKLLSQELYDGIRRAQQDNMEQSLDQLSLLMRNNPVSYTHLTLPTKA